MKAISSLLRVVGILLAANTSSLAQSPVYEAPPGTGAVYVAAPQPSSAAGTAAPQRRQFYSPFTGRPLESPFKDKRLMTGREIRDSVSSFFNRVFKRGGTSPAATAGGGQVPIPQYAPPPPVYQVAPSAPQGGSEGIAEPLEETPAPATQASKKVVTAKATASKTTGKPSQRSRPKTDEVATESPAPAPPRKVVSAPPPYPNPGNPAAQTAEMPKPQAATTKEVAPAPAPNPPATQMSEAAKAPAPNPAVTQSPPGDAKPKEPAAKPAGNYLMARKAQKPGRVISPYPPYRELDISGLSSGSLARDPTSGKIFVVP